MDQYECLFFLRESVEKELAKNNQPSLDQQRQILQDKARQDAEETRNAHAKRQTRKDELNTLRQKRKASVLEVLNMEDEDFDILMQIKSDTMEPLLKKPKLLGSREQATLESQVSELKRACQVEKLLRKEKKHQEQLQLEERQRLKQSREQETERINKLKKEANQRHVDERRVEWQKTLSQCISDPKEFEMYQGPQIELRTIEDLFQLDKKHLKQRDVELRLMNWQQQFNCTTCTTERLFSLQGLIQHSQSVHKNHICMRFSNNSVPDTFTMLSFVVTN